jgi:uncharacterized membrane protein
VNLKEILLKKYLCHHHVQKSFLQILRRDARTRKCKLDATGEMRAIFVCSFQFSFKPETDEQLATFRICTKSKDGR